jgi:hypothetical protein
MSITKTTVILIRQSPRASTRLKNIRKPQCPNVTSFAREGSDHALIEEFVVTLWQRAVWVGKRSATSKD